MNERLRAAMDHLAAESETVEPFPGIEAALLAEFDRVKRRRNTRSWMTLAGAVAACIVLALVLKYRPHPTIPTQPVPVAGDVQESDSAFVPIPYVTPLGQYERAEVVRMEVPVAALIAAGLQVRTADPGARAEADVLVGQDGRARAVRLISISSLN